MATAAPLLTHPLERGRAAASACGRVPHVTDYACVAA